MIPAAVDLVKFLAGLADVAPETMERILWGALGISLLGATIHLITMLATRWGDHEATAKSLIFSLILHFTCALGLLAAKPFDAEDVPVLPEPENVEVRELFVEGEEEIERPASGNTPIWEKIAEPVEDQLARWDHSRIPLEPLKTPDRQPEPIAPQELLIEKPMLPDEPISTPELSKVTEQIGPQSVAAIPSTIDEETAEARPELESPSISQERRPMANRGLTEPEVIRNSDPGAIDRLEAEFVPERRVAAIDRAPDPSSLLERGTDEVVVRRVGPAPPTTPRDESGVAANEETDQSGNASPERPQLTRLRTRTVQSRIDGSLERLQPQRMPRTPEPELDTGLDVREGVALSRSRDILKPNLVRPDLKALDSRKKSNLPPTYRLRDLDHRADNARRYGGTEASERAVEASLQWLALHQDPKGYWDADGFWLNCPDGDVCTGTAGRQLHGDERRSRGDRLAGLKADAGLTALATLAFLGAGYTHEEGQYADHVNRALRWLINQQRDDGYLGGEATHYARMYCHAMATYALAEAYGMQADPQADKSLRDPLARAIRYIIEQQNSEDGGWRYVKGYRGDMSMFGWQLMALKSAEIAGLPIPDETRKRMIRFLKANSVGDHGGLAAYRKIEPALEPTPAMTAEALFSKQMLGISRENPACREAVGFLLQHPPKRSELNLYYWYYGTLAMYQYGGESWREWNESMRDVLVAEQIQTGHAAGSWEPRGPWGRSGGRIYSTAVSTLCLEVYYRFLPLYQMGGQYNRAAGGGGRVQ